MFTGLVQTSSPVVAVEPRGSLRRLTVKLDVADVKPGDSIAINGACLTAVETAGDVVAFDVVPETLTRTNLGRLRGGDLVHVERALRIGDRFDGHFVQGHVDCTAALRARHQQGDDVRLLIDLPGQIARYLAPKGSICIDGVSLTVAALLPESFEVALIPATLALTQLGRREPGYAFNVECDMIGKTVVRYLEMRDSGGR